MCDILNQPERMCIACRLKASQKTLIRLQCINGELSSFKGEGRSFYFCHECVTDRKKMVRSLARMCRSNATEILFNRLKEIIVDE
ncbi:MAG: hypothetical protein U9P71_09690 [Campylobacterota bacterium]|nr:hypothetical protein [Campylobacterota bacterium]